MRTLHSYAARELLKTFLMTAAALTVLLVMGGGVANLFRGGEGAGAGELLKVFMFSTPVAVTLVLPVAALFSAAITYGRMAADNEILACRAAGMNIHRLLLSAFLLGLAVTIFTFWSWNFLLPSLSGQIADLSRKDLPSIVAGQFQSAKALSYGNYNIAATRCEEATPEMLSRENIPPDKLANHTYLHLTGVCFIEMADQEPAKFGTADETIVDFDRSKEIPRITVGLEDVRSFDAVRKQYYEVKSQTLGPFDFPFAVKQKPKFETLTRLQYYRRHPESIPEIDDRLWGMRREMMVYFLAGEVEDALRHGSCTLQGNDFTYQLEATNYRIDPYDGRPSLKGNVRVTEQRASEKRLYTAETAYLTLKNSLDRTNPIIEVELVGDVESSRIPPLPEDHVVKKPRDTLQPVSFLGQEGLKRQMQSFDLLSLLDDSRQLPLFERQVKQREKLLTRLAEFQSEMLGEIHFRASYSLGTIAVVLFGAILGIIVRGGQVLTAFGVSCIPMVFVVVTAIAGRSLADRPKLLLMSIVIMWGGTVLMYAATTYVATKVLKR